MAEFVGPVVLLDPGNFSPQYTANLCASITQLGVDVTLIQSALRLSPEARIEQAYQFTAGMINDRARVRSKSVG